ncbi:radical SAM protein [Methanolobus halotolerans]|uniref:Radical SAM protein n=1 Tax=Methanolobus halotolerans TaxID=2052935 RepID=A0A4E0PUK7_9EURY|nr:radical SAM protein [Methanolobus halotolerans]TGC07008.1 radical SAM protein [Methanolobus halotolerans]
MRLIDLSDAKGQIRVEFAGCNMRCPYCVHIHQPMKEWSVEDIVDFAKKSTTENVYLGGAEPTLQKDILQLIEQLNDTGKKIILKSNGMKPDVLESALPFVEGSVLEIKAPLDDIQAIMELTGMSGERTQKYVDLLHRSLEITRQKWLRIWIRVIPEYVNTDTMPRILPELEGASEVMLYQFMSNPEFDLPFKGHEEPTPSWGDLKELGRMVLQKVPQVRLVGDRGKMVLKR